MEAFVIGIAFGFVMAFVVFWSSRIKQQGRIEDLEIERDVLRKKCEELYRNNIEWQEMAKTCGYEDLFRRF